MLSILNRLIIHWLRCENLCLRKKLGRLNLRELELFNQALLAKQACIILLNPFSLVCKVLKGDISLYALF